MDKKLQIMEEQIIQIGRPRNIRKSIGKVRISLAELEAKVRTNYNDFKERQEFIVKINDIQNILESLEND
jgi:hypothetical protein